MPKSCQETAKSIKHHGCQRQYQPGNVSDYVTGYLVDSESVGWFGVSSFFGMCGGSFR